MQASSWLLTDEAACRREAEIENKLPEENRHSQLSLPDAASDGPVFLSEGWINAYPQEKNGHLSISSSTKFIPAQP